MVISVEPSSFSSVQFSSVQSLSRVRLFATPWIAARQASLSITNSRISPRLTSIESVMPSSHLVLWGPVRVDLLPLQVQSTQKKTYFQRPREKALLRGPFRSELWGTETVAFRYFLSLVSCYGSQAPHITGSWKMRRLTDGISTHQPPGWGERR